MNQGKPSSLQERYHEKYRKINENRGKLKIFFEDDLDSIGKHVRQNTNILRHKSIKYNEKSSLLSVDGGSLESVHNVGSTADSPLMLIGSS